VGHWGTRRFLRKTENGSFEAQLGQTTVILSEQETKELCSCIDDVCHAYKAILVSTEDVLQTWDYLPVSMPGSQLHGFTILTVEPWLWKLMRRFAREFDFLAGTSPWHIFDRENFGLRVHHGQEVEHVLIYPSHGGKPVYLPKETIDLLYCIEEDQYFGYIYGYVFGAARRANRVQFQAASEKEHSASQEGGGDRHQEDEEVSPAQMMNEIIEGLDEHVRRIHLVDHESPRVADFVSSALIALLEHGTIHCGQEHLNAAREAILPLLDLSRFERRYILRPLWA